MKKIVTVKKNDNITLGFIVTIIGAIVCADFWYRKGQSHLVNRILSGEIDYIDLKEVKKTKI